MSNADEIYAYFVEVFGRVEEDHLPHSCRVIAQFAIQWLEDVQRNGGRLPVLHIPSRSAANVQVRSLPRAVYL